jgi:hypothetical protein
LNYGSEALRNDKEFMLEAVKINGNAFQFASEELKKEIDILLIAIKKNSYNSKYVCEHQHLLKELVRRIKEENSSEYFQVYDYISDGSSTYSNQSLKVRSINSIPEMEEQYSKNLDNEQNHIKYLPQKVNKPKFYGNPCILCEKNDYYPTSFKIKEEEGRFWNTFEYYCPNCCLQYEEYDCFEWSY